MKKNGFTLTELLVVLAILAILAAVLVPTLSSVNKKANKTADQTTAESIDTCIYEWMTTEYNSNALYKENLYNNEDISSLGLGFIGGDSENMYCYNYAGTEQLPGVELTNELQIRHSVITAIKAVSGTHIRVKDGEQFIDGPKSGPEYGYKYYYKIGKVNTEKVDSTESELGSDEVYNYFIWLDRDGGCIDTNTVPKKDKEDQYSYIWVGNYCAFNFNFGTRDISAISIEISQAGSQKHTFSGVSQTPAIFKNGKYDVRCYYYGDLIYENLDLNINQSFSATVN